MVQPDVVGTQHLPVRADQGLKPRASGLTGEGAVGEPLEATGRVQASLSARDLPEGVESSGTRSLPMSYAHAWPVALCSGARHSASVTPQPVEVL